MSEASRDLETWLPVVGSEGWYEVSDHGRVRSVDRVHHTLWRGRPRSWRYKGQLLSNRPDRRGYVRVNISRKGQGQKLRAVHQLVLEAFVGPRPPGMAEALHADDDKANNRLSNLRWGTHSDNMRDMVRNGNNPHCNRERCPFGHLLKAPNLVTAMLPAGKRVCRTCNRSRTDVRNAMDRRGQVLCLAERQRHHYTQIMHDFEDESVVSAHLMTHGPAVVETVTRSDHIEALMPQPRPPANTASGYSVAVGPQKLMTGDGAV